MGKFTSELIVTPLAHRMWRLREPLVFVDSEGNVYEVPENFECDLASIPSLLEGYVTPASFGAFVYASAAVVHDFLLTTDMPSSEAHNLFREALGACDGANAFIIELMYHAVNRPKKESEMDYSDITESEGHNKGLGD